MRRAVGNGLLSLATVALLVLGLVACSSSSAW